MGAWGMIACVRVCGGWGGGRGIVVCKRGCVGVVEEGGGSVVSHSNELIVPHVVI